MYYISFHDSFIWFITCDFPSIIDHSTYKLYSHITLFLNLKHLTNTRFVHNLITIIRDKTGLRLLNWNLHYLLGCVWSRCLLVEISIQLYYWGEFIAHFLTILCGEIHAYKTEHMSFTLVFIYRLTIIIA